MSRSRTTNNESMYISDADKLLDRAFQGDQLAVANLRASAPFMSPPQAMGLLRRMGHPAQGDVLATPNAGPGWEFDREDLIAAFQNRSRQEPFQHLLGNLGELKKVPIDKQSGSAEFSELRRTINGLSKADARRVLPSFEFGPDPGLSPDAFRQLRQGLQDRAGVRVSTKSGVGELKDFGDFGVKGKESGKFPSKDPQVQDAYKNAMVSPTVGAYGEGRTLFGRGTYQNIPSLQLDKQDGRYRIEGKTTRGEHGYRVYDGTLSSIDPNKPANANQSYMVGVQAQSNLIHANYTVKGERKIRTLAGKKVQTSFERSVDSYIGANGGTRVVFSAGPYPAIQIQGFMFAGARTEVQVVQGKLDVGGRPLGEFRVKAYGSVGGEASSTFSFGHVCDSVKGKVIITGAEVGVTAFAGARSGLEIAGDLAGIGGKVKGEVLKGVGWVGKIYAKSENGVLSFGGEHGAALGVGGTVSWGVSINPGKVVKAIPDKIGAAISGAPEAVGRKVGGGAKFVANAAATQAQTVGKALHSAAVDSRDRAINGGRIVGTFAANARTAAGTQAQNFEQTAGKFSADLSRKIRSQQVSRPSPTTEPLRHMRQVGHRSVGPGL